MQPGEITRVLIADGDTALRQQLFAAMVDGGIQADCVNSVAAAIAGLREHEYAVIVLDIGLPGGDVAQVVSTISAQGTRPVVVVLGSPEAARSLDVEVVQIVIRRPVRLQQVVEIIRSCARGSGVRAPMIEPKPKGDQLIS